MDLDVRVLAAPAALPDEAAVAIGRLRDSFFVCNLLTAEACFDVEFAFEPLDDDLEVQLAHAANHKLARRFVSFHADRGIVRHERGEALTEPL